MSTMNRSSVRASRHRRLTRLSNAHAVESHAFNLWRSRIQLGAGFELRPYVTPPITSGLQFRGETALFRRMLGVTVPLTYELPPSSRGHCCPRPSLTRTSAIHACGSSPYSFAHTTVYRWTIRGRGRAKRWSTRSYRSHFMWLLDDRRDNQLRHTRRTSWCNRTRRRKLPVMPK
jgi:hypothetical protein